MPRSVKAAINLPVLGQHYKAHLGFRQLDQLQFNVTLHDLLFRHTKQVETLVKAYLISLQEADGLRLMMRWRCANSAGGNRLARVNQRAGTFARHKLGAALNQQPDKTKRRESVDSARDKRTGDIIDAEQLWDLEVVDKDAYECLGCGIQVFPASYRKNINKKRPYFTPMDNKHIQPCGVDGVEKLVKKAKKEKVGTPEGFPVPFPNRLRFDEERPVTTGGDAPRAVEGTGRTRTRANGERGAAYHGHTVKTIRPVCRVFMDFPNDRAQLPLEIPGCPGTTYTTIFRGLGFFGIETQQSPTRLFCAALRWGSAVETDTYIEWALDAGEWPKGEKRPTRFYKVRVMWAEWTDRQRNTLREEIEIAKDAVKGKAGQPEKGVSEFLCARHFEPSRIT